MKKLIYILFVLIISCDLFADVKEIVPGVTLERFNTYNGEKQIINIAKIDLTKDYIHLGIGLGDKNKTVKDKPYGKEAVSQIVTKHNALLGVNADYFILETFRDNLNFSLYKGEIISEPQYNRSVMFINRDNHIFFDVPKLTTTAILGDGSEFTITGINRARNAGDTILFTDSYANSTLSKYAGYDLVCYPIFNEKPIPNREITYQVRNILPNSTNTLIGEGCVVISSTLKSNPKLAELQIGDVFTISYKLEAKEDISNTIYATGGGPMLIEDGIINIEPGNFKNDILKGRNPRTCVGVNRDNTELILITVDGRCENSKGMTLNELANLLLENGAYNGMNLDGGGSTTMSVLGLVMNSLSGVTERYVANALLVYSDYKGTQTESPDYNNSILRCSSMYNLCKGKEIWGTFGGVGYFDGNNVFMTGSKEKSGKIGYILDGIKYEYNIELSNATLGDVVIDNVENMSDEETLTYICSMKLLDTDTKPMSFSPIFIYNDFGSVNNTRFISDKDGNVKFMVKFPNTEETQKRIRIVFGNFVREIEF